MSREKLFNEDAAIEKAMKVFWEMGFEPASIASLLEGMELNRGSFYNAFGGKQQLFEKALLKYDSEYRRPMMARLEALNNPKLCIESFFDEIVVKTVSDQEQKGCFLLNTATVIATHNEKVNDIVTNGIREIEGFFRRCIEVGQSRNEIPKTLDPETTAKTLLALTVSIRVLGRGVFAEDALRTIANQAKSIVNSGSLCERELVG